MGSIISIGEIKRNMNLSDYMIDPLFNTSYNLIAIYYPIDSEDD